MKTRNIICAAMALLVSVTAMATSYTACTSTPRSTVVATSTAMPPSPSTPISTAVAMWIASANPRYSGMTGGSEALNQRNRHQKETALMYNSVKEDIFAIIKHL